MALKRKPYLLMAFYGKSWENVSNYIMPPIDVEEMLLVYSTGLAAAKFKLSQHLKKSVEGTPRVITNLRIESLTLE